MPRRPSRTSQLERRVAALERRLAGAAPAPTARIVDTDDDPGAHAMPWIQRLAGKASARFKRGDVRGGVGYVGSLQAGSRRYAWTHETGIAELVDADLPGVARWLAAIASPSRLAVVLALLGHDRSSAELGTALGDPSPGQVYHHLKELQAGGVIVQVRRGIYRIAPAVLIPLLAVLAAASDARSANSTDQIESYPLEVRTGA